MKLKDVEACIECEGRRLPEYSMQVEGEDGKTVACFIPSEADKVGRSVGA